MYNTNERHTESVTDQPSNNPQSIAREDTAMNAIVSSLYRDLTCAAAAMLISMVIGASFVHSTATVPGTASAPAATALHA